MAADPLYTFDLATPRRPSLEDLGGATKEDETGYAPNPSTDPTADEHNQFANLLAGIAKVIPVCSIDIAFSAGTPSVNAFASVSNNPVLGTFTVTDNGTGDTSITWPASTFPTAIGQPRVSLNVSGAVAKWNASAINITNGVRVRTGIDAVATDMNFTVDIR